MRKRFILVCMSLLLSLTLIGCKSESEQPPSTLEKLIADVFHPQQYEVVLVMIDMPHENLADNELWMSQLNGIMPSEDWAKNTILKCFHY